MAMAQKARSLVLFGSKSSELSIIKAPQLPRLHWVEQHHSSVTKHKTPPSGDTAKVADDEITCPGCQKSIVLKYCIS